MNRYRARMLFAAVAVALTAAAPPGKTGLPGPTIPEGFGVNIHFTDPKPGEMERFAEAGFKWVRMDLGWAGVEKKPGEYDFSAFDRLVGHLDRVGARAYFILDYGHPKYDGGMSPHTPEGRAGFTAYAKAAATHFRGRGVIWEIWNEPNIAFWKPKPNADDYTKLANETVDALREGDPDAFVMAPASSQFPWDFFETLFASGILEKLDAVSVHPYRETNPETAADDYGRLRAMIARYASPGRRMLPIVSGEWGYSTAEKRFSEAEQARYIVREYLSNLANGVNLSIFYDWKDDGPDPKENEHRFGTVRQDLTPKPSFLAAKELMRTLKGYTFRHRLKGANPSEWKLLFSDPESSLAVVSWTTDVKASEAARTPSIRLVKAADPDAEDLRVLSHIALPAGPVLEGRGFHPGLSVGVVVSDENEPTFRIAGGPRPLPTSEVMRSGPATALTVSLPANPLRAPHREIPLEITYKDRLLPTIAPLQVWRIDPLGFTLAPRGAAYEAMIANPSKLPFQGRLVARGSDGKELASVVISIPEGEKELGRSLDVKARTFEAALVDAEGATVTTPIVGRFEPILGPDRRDVMDDFDAVLHVDNKAQPARPLKATIERADGRDERVLKVDYRFDPGWRYLTVRPHERLPIPEKAREALIWIKGDGSGAYVRGRITDASGQTFQPDLGRLDFHGWRLVRVPLDGSGGGGRWGGANDGVPHRPLAWEAVLLLDSPNREKGGSGSALIASPSYRLDP